MTRTQVFLVAAIQLASTALCGAAVSGEDKLDIDFSQPQDATQKAVWHMAGHSTSRPADDAEHPYPDWWRNQTWIHTKPLAVGPRKRSPDGVSVHVEIQPPGRERPFPGGHTAPPANGMLYIRYSPDRLHWSSWQALQPGDDHPRVEGSTGRFFSGIVKVPMLEHAEYSKLSVRDGELTKDWHHNDTVSRWILHNDPQFFARQLPFIAYVEFLFEADFSDDVPIESFHARLGWMVSGVWFGQTITVPGRCPLGGPDQPPIPGNRSLVRPFFQHATGQMMEDGMARLRRR